MQDPTLTQPEMEASCQLNEDAERRMILAALIAGMAVSLMIIFVHAAA